MIQNQFVRLSLPRSPRKEDSQVLCLTVPAYVCSSLVTFLFQYVSSLSIESENPLRPTTSANMHTHSQAHSVLYIIIYTHICLIYNIISLNNRIYKRR